MMQELKPCPFCGGWIRITERSCSIGETFTGALCTTCGMEFRYTEEYAYSKIARIRLTESFEDLWNRRTPE